MKLLKKYILLNYSQTFFPIFLTLYIITSIIFLVKIAALTSIIQINFIELLLLYSFSVPTILFYTMPLSIFVSLSLALSKLSSEYELIVITSFGFKPFKIIKLILPSLILSTVLLLVISLALIPKAEYLKKTFLNVKKTEAQFNIKASEYGQEFADWLIYVDKEDKGLYKNIVLLKTDDTKDTFIISKLATMKNENLSLSLNLQTGKAITIEDNINQIDFERMVISDRIKISDNINTFQDLLLYWKDIDTSKSKEAKFTFAILNSLLPLLSIFFIIYIGYFNPRYEKNNSTSLSLVLTIIYIVITHKLSKQYGLTVLAYLPAIWLVLGYIIYSFKTKKTY